VKDADRIRLYFGHYRTPIFKYGDVVICDVRGQVEIVGPSSGPIPWPIGKRGRHKAIAVFVVAPRRRALHGCGGSTLRSRKLSPVGRGRRPRVGTPSETPFVERRSLRRRGARPDRGTSSKPCEKEGPGSPRATRRGRRSAPASGEPESDRLDPIPLALTESTMFDDAELIHSYSRADAIRDGVLIDRKTTFSP
jgi:hypothetical protein